MCAIYNYNDFVFSVKDLYFNFFVTLFSLAVVFVLVSCRFAVVFYCFVCALVGKNGFANYRELEIKNQIKCLSFSQ